MKTRAIAVLAGSVFVLALTGFGGPTSAAPAQPEEDVASCVLGDWESTDVTVAGGAMADFDIGGGGGALLAIDDDGTATVDFTDMDQITFEGEAHDQTFNGFVEYRGEATGTVGTTDETDSSGTLEPSDVSWEDVQLTIALSEPFASRPVDRVPLDELRQMTERHHMATLAPVLSESTYECGADTLTLTSTDEGGMGRHEVEITWTFERAAE